MKRYTFLGPVFTKKIYFVTRHSKPIMSSINPLSSLDSKFWANYCLLHGITVLVAITLYLKLLKGLTLKQLWTVIISPSQSSLFKGEFKSGLMLSCLIAFTLWTFNVLFGVDLAAVLVEQTFEPEVNDWQDLDFFDTTFVVFAYIWVRRDGHLSNLMGFPFFTIISQCSCLNCQRLWSHYLAIKAGWRFIRANLMQIGLLVFEKTGQLCGMAV